MLWAVPGPGCPTSCQLVGAFRQGDPDKLAARRTTEQESAEEATALMRWNERIAWELASLVCKRTASIHRGGW